MAIMISFRVGPSVLAIATILAAGAFVPISAASAQSTPGAPTAPTPTQTTTSVTAIQEGQPAAGSQEADRLEDIVVTAERRETRLQDTPIAITALTADALARSGVNRVEDISKLVPGLSIPGPSLNNNQAVAIRGISFYSGVTAVSYPVAFYVDGLFTDRPYSIRDHLFDIERVEVLRGPQGVQFGRNATAGAIQIIHQLPTNEWVALGRIEGGSFGTAQGQFSVRGPIVEDKIQVGLAGQFSRSDGYVTNDVTGQKLFGEDSRGVRGTVRLLPTDAIDIVLRASLQHNRNSFGLKNIRTFGTDIYPAIFNDPAYAPLHLGNDIDGFTSRDTYSASGEGNWRLPGVTLTLLVGAQGFTQNSNGDSDGTPTPISQNYQRNVNYNSFSTEARAATTGTGPFRLDAGLYYIREHPHEYDNDVRQNTISATGAITRTAGTYFRDQETIGDSYAVFGQLTWRPLARMSLVVGGRYSIETKNAIFDYDQYIAAVPNQIVANGETTWRSFTPRFTLDYRWSDAFFTYATVSKGFKSGGYNIPTTTLPLTAFNPENVWNYEAGFKSDLLDRRLRLNVAAFYMDYDNIQVSQNIAGGLSLIQNAATSSIKGVEVETDIRPFKGLVIGAQAAYLDAHYSDFQFNPTTNLAGQPLNRAPRWKWSLTGEYNHPLGDRLVGGLRATYSYEGSEYFENLAAVPQGAALSRAAFLRPPVRLLDLRASIRTAEGHWEVAGVVRNATNQIYFSNLQNLIGGATRGAYYAQPRYFGGEISFKY